MNTRIIRATRGLAITLGAFCVFYGTAPHNAQAGLWDKKTVVTVQEPIQVRDTVLPPGQYVFKLADSDSDRHIVQIFNRDESRIIDTELAIPNWRNEVTDHSSFTFYETPAGYNKAMRAWFYPGDSSGQEFPYPKHLMQVAMARATDQNTMALAKPEPAPQPEPAAREEEPIATPAPAPEPQERTEIAQNTPPPAPATVPPDNNANTNNHAEEPRTLPRTATPLPLIGASGLMLMGFGGLLFRRRIRA